MNPRYPICWIDHFLHRTPRAFISIFYDINQAYDLVIFGITHHPGSEDFIQVNVIKSLDTSLEVPLVILESGYFDLGSVKIEGRLSDKIGLDQFLGFLDFYFKKYVFSNIWIFKKGNKINFGLRYCNSDNQEFFESNSNFIEACFEFKAFLENKI